MKQNEIAKLLKIIGYVELGCGILVGILYIALFEDLFVIGLAIMICSVIPYAMFLGFSEIINLLQKNSDSQQKIIETLIVNNSGSKQHAKTLVENIEESLPVL